LTIYWLLFAIPAFATFTSDQRFAGAKREGWIIVWAVFVLAIGYRREIGCDWEPYVYLLELTRGMHITETWQIIDPGYATIDWFVGNVLDSDIFAVNLISGAIFVTGLIAFVRQQPSPSLALAVSVPYLVVVVAMGYTRQSIALGLIFWGLARLLDKPAWQYVVIVCLASFFHKTALLMLPIGLVAASRSQLAKALAISLLGVVLTYVLLSEHYESLWLHYVEEEMESEGGAIRVWMNALPTIFMLAVWKRWKERYSDYRVWFWIGMMSLLCVPLVSLASTAVDRVALYFTPIQLVVLSRLPELVRNEFMRPVWRFAGIALYATVLWVWLTRSIHADLCWLPYQTPWF